MIKQTKKMKKTVFMLCAMACLLAAAPVQAQLRWGIKVGTNLNRLSLKSGSQNLKVENMAGFFAGPMVDWTLLGGFGVDGSLLYSQKGAKVDGDKKRQHAIEIPLNLKYSIGLGDMASVFATAGPDFLFNLKSDRIWDDVKRKNAEVGINVGLGVKLINHLQIAANYNIPLTKSVDERLTVAGVAGDVISGKNKTWQISVAYLF